MGTGHDAWTLLGGGAIGGPLFIAVFTVEGARRDGCGPLREPVSALALGERGWVQRIDFVATGMLMLGCSRGLGRLPADHPAASPWGAGLVGLYAIGLVGAGVFVTDPVEYGAPEPGAPMEPSQRGMLHGLFSLQVFATLGGGRTDVRLTLRQDSEASMGGHVGPRRSPRAGWSRGVRSPAVAGRRTPPRCGTHPATDHLRRVELDQRPRAGGAVHGATSLTSLAAEGPGAVGDGVLVARR